MIKSPSAKKVVLVTLLTNFSTISCPNRTIREGWHVFLDYLPYLPLIDICLSAHRRYLSILFDTCNISLQGY